MPTREWFATTKYKMSYEEYIKCYCPECKRENCPHRDAYRRMPEIDGGLNLCPNLKGDDQMSQRAVFVEVDGEQYEEIFHSVPDGEDCLSICLDMGMESGEHEIEYEWYEIGAGESDTDEFFIEEELLDMKRKDKFEEYMEKQGYETELVQSGTIMIEVQEDE